MLKKITIAALSAVLLQSSAMGAAGLFSRTVKLRGASLLPQTGHPFSHKAPTFTHEESHQKGSWRSWGARVTGAGALIGGILAYKNDKLPQCNEDLEDERARFISVLISDPFSVFSPFDKYCSVENVKKFESVLRKVDNEFPFSPSYFNLNYICDRSTRLSDKTLNWMLNMVRNYPELDALTKRYHTNQYSLEDLLTMILKNRKDNLYNKLVIPPIPSEDGGFYVIDNWNIERFDDQDRHCPVVYYTTGIDIFYGTEIKGIFYGLTIQGLIYPFEEYSTGKYLGSDFFEEFAANIQDPNIRTIVESYWKIAYCNWKNFDLAEKNDALAKLKELMPEYPIFRNGVINYYLTKFPNGLYQPKKLADDVFELNGYIVLFMPDGCFYLKHDDDLGYIFYSAHGKPLREVTKDEVVLKIEEIHGSKRVIDGPSDRRHIKHKELLYSIQYNEGKAYLTCASLASVNLHTIWTHKVPSLTRLQLSTNGRTVFTSGKGITHAFDAQTGKELWSVKVNSNYMYPSACGKYLYCFQYQNLSRITVATGEHEELGELDYKYSKNFHSLPDGKFFISHTGEWLFQDCGFPNPYPLGV